MGRLDKAFFEEMEDKCPYAIDVFKKWIIGYQKKEVWRNLFRDGVQFEDIPIEMQMGVMNRFLIETYAGQQEYAENCEPRYKKDMAESIEQLQGRLRPQTGMN